MQEPTANNVVDEYDGFGIDRSHNLVYVNSITDAEYNRSITKQYINEIFKRKYINSNKLQKINCNNVIYALASKFHSIWIIF